MRKRHDALGAWYRGFEVGDEVHWLPAVSYLNFVVTNGVVLVPAYSREGLPEREREKDDFVWQTFQFRDGLLRGQVVLVSGGGRGIGCAICYLCGRLGASVVACGRDETKLARLGANLERLGVPWLTRAITIRDPVQRDYEAEASRSERRSPHSFCGHPDGLRLAEHRP